VIWDETLLQEMAYLLQDYEKRRGPVSPAPYLSKRRGFPTTKQRVRLFKRALIEAGRLTQMAHEEAIRALMPRGCRRFSSQNRNRQGPLRVKRLRHP